MMRGKLTKNDSFISKGLVIGVSVDDIMAEFNAFDWMQIKDANETELLNDFKRRTGFDSQNNKLRNLAFRYKFEQALKNLSALVEEVHASYNIPAPKGINNAEINKYYYLKLWADKKGIAVNYNETQYNKRKIFNFYTILFDIFADKLTHFNAFNAQKAKK
jgi:hypothetical protein